MLPLQGARVPPIPGRGTKIPRAAVQPKTKNRKKKMLSPCIPAANAVPLGAARELGPGMFWWGEREVLATSFAALGCVPTPPERFTEWGGE